MIWALVLVTTLNTTGIPDRLSFFESEKECTRWIPVERFHLESTGRPVASATCVAIRRDGRIGR